MISSPLGSIMQLGFVVDDLDVAVRDWASQLSAGPFFVTDPIEYVVCEYEDAPISLTISCAFGYSGDTQIELIQQHSSAATVYVRPDGGPVSGLHHFGIVTTDLERDEARLISQGFRRAQRGMAPGGGEVRYYSGPTPFLVELIVLPEGAETFFGQLKGAAKAWDGQNPFLNR